MSVSATTTTTALYPTASSSIIALPPSTELLLPSVGSPGKTTTASTKKHADGHIPRPRNAFILFRSDYARKQQLLASTSAGVERENQNDLSRSVGRVWRAMTDAERAPWHALAEEEKKRHAAQYPGYKYAPRARKAPPTANSTPGPILRKVTQQHDQETAYYPPYATIDASRPRATSYPPTKSVRVKPYTQSQVRSSLRIDLAPAPGPSSSSDDEDTQDSDSDDDMFPPEVSVPLLTAACWNVDVEPDQRLSRPALSPTNYFHAPSRSTPRKTQLQSSSSEGSLQSHSPSSKSPSSCASSSSPSPPTPTPTPKTPPDRFLPPPVTATLPLSYDPNRDFFGEFGHMYEGTRVCASATLSPRESSERTTAS
ncbi:hypothetical protein C8F01DRAFT_1101214 [Mycena amicta]|nr:hypothetical protein C8F01DRAFT_1101214 [Mycena amicta]